MKNLEVYKQEIFRRSAQRIQKRRRVRRWAVTLCIPLVLTLTLVLPTLLEPEVAGDAPMEIESPNETVAQNDYATGSIFSSYVRAELSLDGQTVTVTDKIKVDKLYNIVGFDQAILYGGSPMKPESVPEHEDGSEQAQPSLDRTEKTQIITFYTSDGNRQMHWVDAEQLERIKKVLK